MSDYTILFNGGHENPDQFTSIVGEVFGATEFEAKRVISTRLPRLYGRFEALHQAEGVAERLRGEGLHCIAGALKDLLEAPEVRTAQSIDFSQSPPVFETRNDPVRPLPEEVFLLVVGRFHSRERTTKVVTRMSHVHQFGPVGPLSTMPIPIKHRETSDDESFERVLVLFHGNWWNALAVREKQFHYRCLGEAMQPTRHANFMKLRELLESHYAPVPVDDRLMRVSVPSQSKVHYDGASMEKRLTDNTNAFWQTAGQMARLAEMKP